jgi:putative two-component system response regulator
MGIARLLGLQVAGALRTALLLEELDGQETVILSLALAIEAKDPYTEGHCQRLADYAVMLGRDLGMSERDIARLRMAALLHDLGKIAVPESILRKPGPLTVEEYEVVKQHPLVGERICRPLRSARAILPGIRHHHEHWDGTGYPDGLRREEIPLDARIIALVDAFDVMVSDRPYRRGMPVARALAIIEENAGPQWDPSLVERFLRLVAAQVPPITDSPIPLRPHGDTALVGGT